GSTTQVGVEDHAGGVDHPAGYRSAQCVEPTPGLRGQVDPVLVSSLIQESTDGVDHQRPRQRAVVDLAHQRIDRGWTGHAPRLGRRPLPPHGASHPLVYSRASCPLFYSWPPIPTTMSSGSPGRWRCTSTTPTCASPSSMPPTGKRAR